MKRKHFLQTTLAALPALLLAKAGLGAPASPTSSEPFVVRAGNSRFGEHLKYRGQHPNDVVISRRDTADALSVFAYTGYAKIGPSLHVHLHQDEWFYVLAGHYRFVVGDRQEELHPGDTIFLPRTIPHSWLQLSDQGQLLYAVQPAGTLEEFFKEMDAVKAPLSAEEAQQIHRRHGMKIVGPPLTL